MDAIELGQRKIEQKLAFLPKNDPTGLDVIKGELRRTAQGKVCLAIGDGRAYAVKLGEVEESGKDSNNWKIEVTYSIALLDPHDAKPGEYVAESAIAPQALDQARGSGKFQVDDHVLLERDGFGWKRAS